MTLRAIPFLGLLACPAAAASAAGQWFAQLKTLAGAWAGTNSAGRPLQVSFREISAGSALLSEIRTGRPGEDMASIIHLDGARLLLTHYCSAGNQPRIAASASPDDKTLTFDFVDATNLTRRSGHMWRVVISILDPSHHT